MTTAPVNGYLTFQAQAAHRNSAGKYDLYEFSALCGDNPPQIVDGYGKWNVVDRPLRQGVTIPLGFNPPRMKVEIRFGVWDGLFGFNGWDTSDQAANKVEIDINSLHLVAGGGQLAGASPVVYVDSYKAGTRKAWTDLVPPQYRGIAWVVDGGIEWGASLRTPSGSRVYQEATFTLLGYANLSSKPPPRTRQLSGGYFKTTPTIHTALGIAGAESGRSPEAYVQSLARAILKDPRNNGKSSRIRLERRSITWKMPVGMNVYVPGHTI